VGYFASRYKPGLDLRKVKAPIEGKKGQFHYYWDTDTSAIAHLTNMVVYVSSRYKPGSCPYEAIATHERVHGKDAVSSFNLHKDSLFTDLEGITVPQAATPFEGTGADVDAEEARLASKVGASLQRFGQKFHKSYSKLKAYRDSAHQYEKVNKQCPKGEW